MKQHDSKWKDEIGSTLLNIHVIPAQHFLYQPVPVECDVPQPELLEVFFLQQAAMGSCQKMKETPWLGVLIPTKLTKSLKKHVPETTSYQNKFTGNVYKFDWVVEYTTVYIYTYEEIRIIPSLRPKSPSILSPSLHATPSQSCWSSHLSHGKQALLKSQETLDSSDRMGMWCLDYCENSSNVENSKQPTAYQSLVVRSWQVIKGKVIEKVAYIWHILRDPPLSIIDGSWITWITFLSKMCFGTERIVLSSPVWQDLWNTSNHSDDDFLQTTSWLMSQFLSWFLSFISVHSTCNILQ